MADCRHWPPAWKVARALIPPSLWVIVLATSARRSDLPRVAGGRNPPLLPVAYRHQQRQSCVERTGAAAKMEVRHVRSRMSGSGTARAFAARLLQGGARGLLRRHGSCAGDRGRGARAQLYLGGRFDSHDVARLPDLLRRAGNQMDKKFDLKKDGFNLYWWRIVEHAGTHLDA